MKLEDILLSEVNQIKKYKYLMASLICGIFKKKKKNPTHRNRKGKWFPGIGAWGKQEEDIFVCLFVDACYLFVQDIYFRVELLNLKVGTYLVLVYNFNVSYKCLQQRSLSAAMHECSSWFMLLPNRVLSIILILTILVGVQCYLVVLIFIFSITKNVEHLCLCILPFRCVCFLESACESLLPISL